MPRRVPVLGQHDMGEALRQCVDDRNDLVAPGDGGWADCSADVTTFTNCATSFGAGDGAPAIENFGGTSQSAPLVAGVAALVIQAYRSTHHDATPTPTQVRQILTSTASDLDAPVEEQGAGLVDARRAVALARVLGSATAAAPDAQLALGTTRLAVTGDPGTAQQASVTVRNHGGSAAVLHPVLEHFGTPKSIVPWAGSSSA